MASGNENMSKEDDHDERQNNSFSDSNELFENIFRQAISETEKPKAGKPNVEQNRRAVTMRAKTQSQSERKASASVDKPVRQTKTTSPQPEKPRPKPLTVPTSAPASAKGKSGTGSSRLRMTMLAVLLVLLAGFLVSYFGVLDLHGITGFLGLGEKKIVPAPHKRITRTLPEKPTAPPPSKQVKQENPPSKKDEIKASPPQAIAQAGPAEPKKVETPASDTLKQEAGGSGTPAPIAEAHPKEEALSAAKVSSPPSQPKPVEDLTKGQTRSPAPAKPAGKELPYRQLIQEPYPYSIYLGSYKTSQNLEKAISVFQEKGLSPYWTRVDLGTKGIWYRLFAGSFPSKEAVESYIRKNQIAGAEVGYTKYANFLGSYQSETELESQKAKLASLGFCPYAVKGADGGTLLYSGAFDREELAKKNQRDLASKGIRNELVER
jgi:hypothetical protein